MTEQQLEIYEKINLINQEINRLQGTIMLLQREQDKLSKQLFDTIEEPKVKKKVNYERL